MRLWRRLSAWWRSLPDPDFTDYDPMEFEVR